MRTILLVRALAALPARADFILTLDPVVISGLPGAHFTLSGSLLNENLFGEDVATLFATTLPSAGASVSQVFAPDFILFGDTYTGNLLEIMHLGASPGVYPATLSFTYDTSNGRSATTNAAAFSVEILPSATTPEPASAWMLSSAAVLYLFRRRHSS